MGTDTRHFAQFFRLEQPFKTVLKRKRSSERALKVP